MRFTAVSSVQPPARSSSPVALIESSSNMTPAPSPAPIAPGEHREHEHRGNHDLVGGNRHDVGEQDHAVEPDQEPERVQPPTTCSATLTPPNVTFETSQITAPAGIAKTTARHSTISVRSISDV